MKKLLSSLHVRLIIVFLGVFIPVSIAASLWFLDYRKDELLRETSQELSRVKADLAAVAQAAIMDGHPQDLEYLLHMGQQLRSAECLAVYGPDGGLIESWPDVDCLKRDAIRTEKLDLGDAGTLVINHGDGWVEAELEKETLHLISVLGLALAAALIAALLSNFLLIRYRLQPLLQAADPEAPDLGRLNQIAGHGDETGTVAQVVVDLVEAERDKAEQQKAEDLAAERAARYRQFESIIESLAEGLITHDADLVIVRNNRAAAEMLGYAREDLTGRHVSELMSPEHFNIYNSTFRNHLATGAPLPEYLWDMQLRRKNGKELKVDVSFNETEADGRRLFTGVMKDRTTERKAQEAARLTHERLLAAIDTSPDGFVMYDADDRLLMANDRFRQIYDRNAETLVPGIRFEDGIRVGVMRGQYADAAGREEEWIAERMNAHLNPPEEPFDQEFADGRWIRVIERRTPEGGVVGFRTEITELKRREIELQKAQERLLAAIETIPDGLMLFDADDRLIMDNAASRSLYGFSSSPVGHSFEELVRSLVEKGAFPEAGGREDEFIAERLEEHKNPPARPIERQLAHGPWIRVKTARTPEGGFVSIRTDITELKQREQRALRAEERLAAAIDAMPDAILILDSDERVVIENKGFRDQHGIMDDPSRRGIKLEDGVRHYLSQNKWPQAKGQEEAWIARTLDEIRKPPKEPVIRQMPDGRWFRLTVNPTSDGGRVRIRTDITELKQQEQEALKAKERLTAAIEAMPDAILILDAEERVVAENQGFRDLHDIRESLHGTKFEDGIRHFLAQGKLPQAHGREEAWIARSLDEMRNPPDAPVIRQMPDGRWFRITVDRTSDGGRVIIRSDITELKKRESELQQAQERLVAAIETIPDAFSLYDGDDRLVYANKPFQDFYKLEMIPIGISFEEGMRELLRQGKLPVPAGREEEAVAQRMEEHRNPPDGPIERQRPDGSWVRIVERRTPEGGHVSLLTDITFEKQHEAELAEARERLVSAIEAVPDAFVLYDAEDRLVICNQRYREVYERSADMIVPGARFEDIIREGARRGQYAEANGREEEWIAERIAAHRNPPERPLLQQLDNGRWLSVMERRTPDGGTVGFRTDITELKQQELVMRESESRIRATIDAALDCIIIMDQHGKVVRFNPAAENLFGWSNDEAAGQEMAALVVPPDLQDAHRKGLAHYLKTGEGPVIGNRIEIEAMNRDGHIFPVELAISVAGGHDGLEFIGYLRDITEIKNARAELTRRRELAEEANRAKGRFLAMMSHEIRTPLNAVLGVLGLLADTELSSEQERFVGTGRQSAVALQTIINDILDFSKMEAGKLELEFAPFDPADLPSIVLEVLKPRAEEKGVSMRLETAPDLPSPLLGDAGRMRQILLNFGSNAVRFTETGEIVFRVSMADGHNDHPRLRFSVADTGPGVPEELQEHLFSDFTSSGKQDQMLGGTGLGLAICKRIVAALDGEIGFDSETGKGSTFWFEVDMVRTRAAPPARSEPAADDEETVRHRKHVRLLLAEDNPANQLVIQAMLEKAGFSLDAVGNGAEAVEAVQRRPYHAVLMDIGMPVMDGLKAASHIRAMDGERAGIPIIAMTAHVLESEKPNILASGMNDFVAKPIDRTHLIRTIDRWTQDKVANTASADDDVANAAAGDEDLIDETVLAQLADETSREVIPQMVQVFTDHLSESLSEIETALRERDASTLDSVAHRIGSSSGSFGATQLFRTCRAVEVAVLAGNEATAFDLGKTLPGLARRSAAALEDLVRRRYAT